MSYAKCHSDGCNPVLQIRGEMSTGDYFGVISDGTNSTATAGAPAIDHYLFVPINDGNRNDVRIACSTCALQVGWCQKDLPNMPGVGMKFTEDQWAAAVKAKVEKEEMLAMLKDKFGVELITKHFGHSL